MPEKYGPVRQTHWDAPGSVRASLMQGSYYQTPTPEQVWQAQQKEIRELAERKDDDMSAVAWCDPGDHAFKAGVPGSQSFNGTVVNEEGQRVERRMDVCPDHAFQSPTQEPSPKAVTERQE